jgi:Circularly permutated YpsA SLOG family
MRIVSGGQSGVDQAALDAAMALGICYGGWVPKGGWAENFQDPPGLLTKYPKMVETETRDPAERTKLNVRDSDATIILVQSNDQEELPGTKLTLETAHRLGRPSLTVAVGDLDAAARLRQWLSDRSGRIPIRTLNVAGPRESEAQGLYAKAKSLLESALQPVLPLSDSDCHESGVASAAPAASQGRP